MIRIKENLDMDKLYALRNIMLGVVIIHQLQRFLILIAYLFCLTRATCKTRCLNLRVYCHDKKRRQEIEKDEEKLWNFALRVNDTKPDKEFEETLYNKTNLETQGKHLSVTIRDSIKREISSNRNANMCKQISTDSLDVKKYDITPIRVLG